ncbi:MAG: PAS domain-containing protein, partial [Clostridia bacterium]|nr:PAS domain-containing protein [Clostridia bacterium]
MSRGDFNVRADDSEPGETGLLARALNTLCDNLSQTIYQLRTEKGQLDEILASLTDGVAAQDGVGMLTHYNPALMQMFGAVKVQKREDLIANSDVWDAFDRVYESGEGETLTLTLPGEKTVWVTISPVTTEDGERSGVVGLFKDMTEMERLEKMRREYVANVSHELRTPLTAVRGLLEPLA